MINPLLTLIFQNPLHAVQHLCESLPEILTLASRSHQRLAIYVDDDLDLPSVLLVGIYDVRMGGPLVELVEDSDRFLSSCQNSARDFTMPFGDRDLQVTPP